VGRAGGMAVPTGHSSFRLYLLQLDRLEGSVFAFVAGVSSYCVLTSVQFDTSV